MKDLLLTIYSFTCTMESTTRFKYIFHTHFIEFQLSIKRVYCKILRVLFLWDTFAV